MENVKQNKLNKGTANGEGLEQIARTKPEIEMTTNSTVKTSSWGIKAVADWNGRNIKDGFLKALYVASNPLWFANGAYLGSVSGQLTGFGAGATYSFTFNETEYGMSRNYDDTMTQVKARSSIATDVVVNQKTIDIKLFRTMQTDIEEYKQNSENAFSLTLSNVTEQNTQRDADLFAARFWDGLYTGRNTGLDIDTAFITDAGKTDFAKGEELNGVLGVAITALKKKITNTLSGIGTGDMGVLLDAEAYRLLAIYIQSLNLGSSQGMAVKSFTDNPSDAIIKILGVDIREEKLLNYTETITTDAKGNIYSLTERPFAAAGTDVRIDFVMGVKGSYWGDYSVLKSQTTLQLGVAPLHTSEFSSLSGHGVTNNALYIVGKATAV